MNPMFLLAIAGALLLVARGRKTTSSSGQPAPAGGTPAASGGGASPWTTVVSSTLTRPLQVDRTKGAFPYGYDGDSMPLNDPRRNARGEWLAERIRAYRDFRAKAQEAFERYRNLVGDKNPPAVGLRNGYFLQYQQHHAAMRKVCAELEEAGVKVDCQVGV